MFLGARRRALCLLALFMAIAPTQNVQAAGGPFATAMVSAASARHVPLAVVEAAAFVNTNWEWIATPALNGGVGPMNITPSQMTLASSVSGHSAESIATNLADNLDAGAALLAHYHTSGTDLDSWQAAVTSEYGPFVANEIYAVLRTGASRTTSTGETISLAPQTLAPTTNLGAPKVSGATSAAETGGVAGVAPASTTSPDYSGATWIPADPSNYTVADRAHDYPIDMIIIHDIEGSYGSAIQLFQTPGFAASAHYVVSYQGQVAQMVLEKDVAWQAGNWDYNTRSIGIEHEGFAYTPGLYTTAEYNASAQIAASICSRWGVPLDRNHVIGHYQVPDPNNPNLFGGEDHHTDPGPYWNWTYYMAQAQADAKVLPSPPHLMPDPVATDGATSATVTWRPARTCRAADDPITGYTVVAQPGGMTMNLPATATSATFTGLTYGTTYSFSVTATNADGQDTATSNRVMVGACTGVSVSASPTTPQLSGTTISVHAAAATCPSPQYEFWVVAPGSSTYQLAQAYSSTSTFTWNTTGLGVGTYRFSVWARDAKSPGMSGNSTGSWDAYNNNLTFALTSIPCTSVAVTASPATSAPVGTSVKVTAKAAGCPHPTYQFALVKPGSNTYQVVQAYSTASTFSWATAGQTTGAYRFSVWARDASSPGTSGNATGRWDAYDNSLGYGLVAARCSSLTAGSTPTASAGVGAAMTISASAAGCPSPRYRFYLAGPGPAAYRMVQDYSASATFSWSTAGLVPGTYRFSIWARDQSSGRTYDTYNNSVTLTLTSCRSVDVTASPASPATIGAAVSLTASAASCPNAGPLYQFWVLAPGATGYTVAQAYSSNATFSWSTAGLAPGVYRFSVWVKDADSGGAASNSAGRWDAYNATVAYTLK